MISKQVSLGVVAFLPFAYSVEESLPLRLDGVPHGVEVYHRLPEVHDRFDLFVYFASYQLLGKVVEALVYRR